MATPMDNFADPTDNETALQIYTNSLTLASCVSQLIILITFVPDLAVFPASLKILSLITIVASMLSALVVFVSNNYACNPAVQIGCTIFLIADFGKWCTYWWRIWLLSYKRNIALAIFMTASMLVTASTFQWWCSVTPGTRLLPRLCAPSTPDNYVYTDLLSSSAGAVQNLIFFVLHIYYMRDYFREVLFGTPMSRPGSAHVHGHVQIQKASTYATMAGAPTNRVSSTLRLFSSSLLLMVIDFWSYALRRFYSSDALIFFLVLWSAQIVDDIIFCAYMRRFASDLMEEKRILALPTLHVSPHGSGTYGGGGRGSQEQASTGPEYVEIGELARQGVGGGNDGRVKYKPASSFVQDGGVGEDRDRTLH